MPIHNAAYDLRSANPFHHIGWGIRFFFSGVPLLLRHPPLLGLSLIPILLTAILLLALAYGCAWLVGQWISGSLGVEWHVIAQVLTFALVLLLTFFIYLPLARVLLAPFSETLSRKAHTINGGLPYQSSLGWMHAIWEAIKLVMMQIAITLAAFSFGVLFPPIGAPLGVIVAVFICGLDFLDVPLAARGLPLRRKLSVIWRNKSLAIGFGVAAYLMLLIPVINLFALPVGVIGATRLSDEIESEI